MADDHNQPINHVFREFSAADLVAVVQSTGDLNNETTETSLVSVQELDAAAPMMISNRSLEFPLLNDGVTESSSSCFPEEKKEMYNETLEQEGKRKVDCGEGSIFVDSGVQDAAGLRRSHSNMSSSRSNDLESRNIETLPLSATEDASPEISDKAWKLKIDVNVQNEGDRSCADGYLGDNDLPHPGSLSPTSHPQPPPKGIDGLKDFHLSLCGHLLRSDMTASEAQEVFEENRVNKVHRNGRL